LFGPEEKRFSDAGYHRNEDPKEEGEMDVR